MQFTMGLALLAAAFGGTYSTAAATVPTPAPYVPQAETVEQYVRSYFADAPIMAEVSKCESKFRQYDKDGTILRGNNPADVGVMQINEYYHKDEAEKMGINLHTIEGNVEYARFLYDREGTAPWVSSSACWGKKVKPSSDQLAVNTTK